jgi:hypothetical protein
VWFSNCWNNFAPFAGYMRRGFKKRGSPRSVGEDINDPAEDSRVKGETTAVSAHSQRYVR